MEIQILAQGKDEADKLRFLRGPIVDVTSNEKLVFCVLEGGMVSGEPSVYIASQNPQGTIILATSLDKLLAAAGGLATLAETRWGWERPEGHATLMPPSPEARKAMTVALINDLIGYEDGLETLRGIYEAIASMPEDDTESSCANCGMPGNPGQHWMDGSGYVCLTTRTNGKDAPPPPGKEG